MSKKRRHLRQNRAANVTANRTSAQNVSVTVPEAARLLGTDPRTVKRYRASGKLSGYVTPGGHWRISRASIDSILHGGPQPAASAATVPSVASAKSRVDEINSQIAEERAIATLEELRLARVDRNQAKRRQEEREQAEAEELRHADQSDRSEREELLRSQRIEQASTRARRKYEREKLADALRMLPADLPEHAVISITAALRENIAGLYEEDDEVADRLVAATVSRMIRPHMKRKDAEAIASHAINRCLSVLAKAYARQPLSKWQIKARNQAVAAVMDLPDPASPEEMATAAISAVAEVNREFEHGERLQSWISQIPYTLARSLPLAGQDDRETARRTVETAYLQLPVGATPYEFESARNAALEPFLATEKTAQLRKSEADAKSRAEFDADFLLLPGVVAYLAELESAPDGWDFEGSRHKIAEQIKQEIRPALIADLPLDPGAGRARVQELVDEWIEAHCETA